MKEIPKPFNTLFNLGLDFIDAASEVLGDMDTNRREVEEKLREAEAAVGRRATLWTQSVNGHEADSHARFRRKAKPSIVGAKRQL